MFNVGITKLFCMIVTFELNCRLFEFIYFWHFNLLFRNIQQLSVCFELLSDLDYLGETFMYSKDTYELQNRCML